MDERILEAFIEEIEKMGMSTDEVKARIAQPPSGDTGPPGKGKDDPRFKANVGRGFGKGMSKGAEDLLAALRSRR